MPTRGTLLPLLWVVSALCPLPACTRETGETSRPDSEPPRVRLLAPADGDWVADTVLVAVEATDAGGVHSVALLADSVGIGVRYAPPWRLAWDTSALADSSSHTLRAEATDRAGNRALSEPVGVRVRRNAAPEVEIISPAADLYLSIEDAPAPWRCRASDPDEGELEGDRIEWLLDGRTLGLRGTVVEAPPLAPGPHRVTARAVDRWGRAGSASCTVTAFRYPSGDDPSAALETLLLALRARDPERASSVLGAAFLALPPGRAPGQAPSTRSSEVHALAELLGHDGLARFVVSARAGTAELLRVGDREMAQIELRGFEIAAFLDCARSARGSGLPTSPACAPPERAAAFPAAGGGEWRVERSAARVILRREREAGGAWRLLTWWDFHGALPERAGGTSWSALKRAAAAGGLCAPGAAGAWDAAGAACAAAPRPAVQSAREESRPSIASRMRAGAPWGASP